MATKIINNFQGRLSRYFNGDVNSGYSKYSTSFGYDPFNKIGQLTWFEQPTRIDPNGTVITDLIVAARPRVESGVTYVYAIGHTGRLYKIQVNSPSSYNPNYDNPVLLATLTAQSPTFKFGASIQFFGTTEKIFIGHDRGVTKINFNGGSETFVGTQASYTSSVPRPSVQFLGKMYFGNGTNLVEIDSTELVISYSKLSPGFPSGTQVRDIDVSPDGNYAQIVVSRIAQADMTTATQDTNSIASGDSYLAYWNGTDGTYTAYNIFSGYAINSNISYGPYSYTMGYDLGGAAMYTGGQKIVSFPNSVSPIFNSLFSTGNMAGFCSPEYDISAGVLKAAMLAYGQYDNELPEGLYRFFRLSATTQTDVAQVPITALVSNLFYGQSSAGYTGNKVGTGKLYFSTVETDSSPATSYKFYKFTTVPTGTGTPILGVWESQNELFSKKIKVGEIRIYCEPFVANNSFTVDLIGSDGASLAGSSKTFTVGTTLTAGEDIAFYSPQVKPTYSLGVRITNAGSANMVFNKIEIDYYAGGK